MTNWVYNKLTISGQDEEVKRFKDRLMRDVNISEPNDVNPNQIELYSAYSPPLGILGRIIARFPELEFYLEFEEPMADYRGFARWANGEMVENEVDFTPIHHPEELESDPAAAGPADAIKGVPLLL